MTAETIKIFSSKEYMDVFVSQVCNTGVLRLIVPENARQEASLAPTLKIIADGNIRMVRVETDDYAATIPAAVFWDAMTQFAKYHGTSDIRQAVEARYNDAVSDYTTLLTDTLTKRLLDEYKDGEMNLNSQFGEDEIPLGQPAVSCRPAILYVSGGVLYVVGEDIDGNEYPEPVKALAPADIKKLIKIYERPLDEDE